MPSQHRSEGYPLDLIIAGHGGRFSGKSQAVLSLSLFFYKTSERQLQLSSFFHTRFFCSSSPKLSRRATNVCDPRHRTLRSAPPKQAHVTGVSTTRDSLGPDLTPSQRELHKIEEVPRLDTEPAPTFNVRKTPLSQNPLNFTTNPSMQA